MQIFDDFVNIRDPGIVDFAYFFLDFFFEKWIIEHSKRYSVLLTEEGVVLIQALWITLIEFLNQQTPHSGLLKLHEITRLHIFLPFFFFLVLSFLTL